MSEHKINPLDIALTDPFGEEGHKMLEASKEMRERNIMVFGKPGKSRKCRPHSHCHGYNIIENGEEKWIKAIQDAEYIKNVLYIAMKLYPKYPSLSFLLHLASDSSDIQLVNKEKSKEEEFKSMTTIHVEDIQAEIRLTELQEELVYHENEKVEPYVGYASFMGYASIVQETKYNLNERKGQY